MRSKGLSLTSVFVATVVVATVLVAGCSQQPPAPAQTAPTSAEKGVAAAPASGKAIELTFATMYPEDQWMSYAPAKWAKEVEKRTGGRVKGNMLWGEALGKIKDYPDMVKQGAADFALVGELYSPGRFPTTDVVTLPSLVPSPAVCSDVMYALYYEGLLPELKDYKLMWFQCTSPGYLYTSKKKVTKLEDLKGMKLRVDAVLNKVVEGWGASPVSLPTADLYMAMDRGVVDGVVTMPQFVNDFKMAEVTKYAVAEPLGMRAWPIIMNLDRWNSLPPDIQVILDRMNDEARYWVLEPHRKGIHDNAELGIEVYDLPAEEKARWRQSTAGLGDAWVKDVEAKGFPAQKALELAKWISSGTN